MLPTPVVAAVLAPFVLWRMYSRIKRLTTRQLSKTWRHRTTLVFFPLLLLGLAAAAVQAGGITLAVLGAGLPLGIVLGRIAIGKTRFEQAGGAFYFTPHAPIGMAIGLGVTAVLHRTGLDLTAVFGSNLSVSGAIVNPVFYPTVRIARAWQGTIVVLALGVLSSLYPMWQASRIDVAEAMQVDQ